jgi:hypothetical protein
MTWGTMKKSFRERACEMDCITKQFIAIETINLEKLELRQPSEESNRNHNDQSAD